MNNLRKSSRKWFLVLGVSGALAVLLVGLPSLLIAQAELGSSDCLKQVRATGAQDPARCVPTGLLTIRLHMPPFREQATALLRTTSGIAEELSPKLAVAGAADGSRRDAIMRSILGATDGRPSPASALGLTCGAFALTAEATNADAGLDPLAAWAALGEPTRLRQAAQASAGRVPSQRWARAVTAAAFRARGIALSVGRPGQGT